MAVYKLRITARAAKELDKLPDKNLRRAVASRILALAEDPRPAGCVKLSGKEPLYRLRHGSYRIVYQIEDGHLIVIVIRIGHRKEVHRKGGQGHSTAQDRRFREPQ